MRGQGENVVRSNNRRPTAPESVGCMIKRLFLGKPLSALWSARPDVVSAAAERPSLRLTGRSAHDAAVRTIMTDKTYTSSRAEQLPHPENDQEVFRIPPRCPLHSARSKR
jgi:hypothetical protein